MFVASAPTVPGPGFTIEVVRLANNEGSAGSLVKAHTCKQNGGMLHLPEFGSRAALREGLTKSICWSRGYTEF